MTSATSADPVPRLGSDSPIYVVAAAGMLLVLALFVTSRGTLLRLAIPTTAVLVGLAFYLRRPIGYLHFTLWTWFLTPLVRRLVDWRVGFEDQNFVLVAPLLVSAISGLTLLRERRAGAVRLTPFLICIGAILYGFAVGLLRTFLHASGAASPAVVVYGLFDWLAPVLFGLHLCLRWPMYEEHKRAIQKSFLWALIVLGTYGLYQFLVAPVWDCYWLTNVMQNENTSFGRPEPLSIRVWSTVNAPGPLSVVLLVGTVSVAGLKSRIKLPALIAGYASFALTLIRTTWLSWLIANVIIFRQSSSRRFQRVLLVLMTGLLCVPVLAVLPSTSNMIVERFGTFTHISDDESFEERSELYKTQLKGSFTNPFGTGLVSNTSIDSGVIMLLTSCGWLGSVAYLVGVIAALGVSGKRVFSEDAFALESYALSIAILAQLWSGNALVSVTGAMLWLCIGNYSSAVTFHRLQELAQSSAAPLSLSPAQLTQPALGLSVQQ